MQYIANLRKSMIDGHKHNSTMISDASSDTTSPKMNESFVHMTHVSSDCACAQDGCMKRPHPTIIDGDRRWDSGWFFWCFGGWGALDTRLARWKLGKKNTPQSWRLPLPNGRHGALLPAPPHTAISQHAARQVYVIKTRKYYCFYYLLDSYFKA